MPSKRPTGVVDSNHTAVLYARRLSYTLTPLLQKEHYDIREVDDNMGRKGGGAADDTGGRRTVSRWRCLAQSPLVVDAACLMQSCKLCQNPIPVVFALKEAWKVRHFWEFPTTLEGDDDGDKKKSQEVLTVVSRYSATFQEFGRPVSKELENLLANKDLSGTKVSEEADDHQHHGTVAPPVTAPPMRRGNERLRDDDVSGIKESWEKHKSRFNDLFDKHIRTEERDAVIQSVEATEMLVAQFGAQHPYFISHLPHEYLRKCFFSVRTLFHERSDTNQRNSEVGDHQGTEGRQRRQTVSDGVSKGGYSPLEESLKSKIALVSDCALSLLERLVVCTRWHPRVYAAGCVVLASRLVGGWPPHLISIGHVLTGAFPLQRGKDPSVEIGEESVSKKRKLEVSASTNSEYFRKLEMQVFEEIMCLWPHHRDAIQQQCELLVVK